MNHIRLNWQKLPSGLVLAVNVCESALAPDALRDEHGQRVSLISLDRADRLAVWAVYRAEREALELAVGV